jgi:hypothetical protein
MAPYTTVTHRTDKWSKHISVKNPDYTITTYYITIKKLRCLSFIMPTISCLPLNSNYISVK